MKLVLLYIDGHFQFTFKHYKNIFRNQIKSTKKMNQITHEDFGVFQTEFLNVDFITFNLNKLSDSQIYQLAIYFQSLGFNCYKKDSEKSKSRQEFSNNNNNNFQNQFELDFILTVPYQKKNMQIQFPGLSAKQFYQLIKRNSIQWENLTKFDIILSRFDLVYERTNKSSDKIDTKEFLNSSYIQFQELHPNRKLVSERNQKGLILKIGNRKGLRHYRIYTRNNSLRFEAEMKGHLIKDFHDLLIASNFKEQDFETRLSYEYFKYSFQLLSPSNQPSHLDWLINRIRPFQYKNPFILDDSMIYSHYLNQLAFKQLKEKQHLITLLRLLIYVRGLKYNTKRLTSEFRQFRFPLREFLKYNKQTPNQYQLNKLKQFFSLVRENFVIESFNDKHYRMIVTIPEVFVYKSEQNTWNVEIWIAEKLFDYLHPFLLPDFFQEKLTKDKFQVLFEIIKVYSSSDIRKEFHIQQFLDNYPSTLSHRQRTLIKQYFIHYIKVLNKQQKLQDKVLDLSYNKLLNINDLNISNLTIAVFENLHIKFS